MSCERERSVADLTARTRRGADLEAVSLRPGSDEEVHCSSYDSPAVQECSLLSDSLGQNSLQEQSTCWVPAYFSSAHAQIIAAS